MYRSLDSSHGDHCNRVNQYAVREIYAKLLMSVVTTLASSRRRKHEEASYTIFKVQCCVSGATNIFEVVNFLKRFLMIQNGYVTRQISSRDDIGELSIMHHL